MTLLELKTEAAGRLNLSSAEALARLGSFINQRYRRLTSSLGLNTSRRSTKSVNTVAGTATITFAFEKIEMVYCTVDGKRRVLKEFMYEDYLLAAVESPREGLPEQYAIKSFAPETVTIALYPTPDAIVSWSADGLNTVTTLADGDTPNIPTSFQDALILGALSDELFKMEKFNLAKDFQMQYEQRASELRLHLAKSAMYSETDTVNPGGLVTVTRNHRRP